MIIFIILRILDTVTTLLNVQKYGGWGVELNPWMEKIGNKGLFIPYQIFITVFGIIIIERSRFKKQIYIALCLVSLIAVLVNSYCLTL